MTGQEHQADQDVPADWIDQRARETLLELTFGYMTSRAVHAMARLGIADLLAGGALTTPAIASATNTDEDAMRRLLRVLAGAGILAETSTDRFELTPLGQPMRSEVPGSVGRLAKLYGTSAIWQAWGRLTSSVRTGEPSIGGGADEVFEGMANNPKMSRTFNAAMAADTEAVAYALARGGYDFSAAGSVVDLGGGNGTLISAVLAANPHLSGILFDTPTGVEHASSTLAATGVADRCEVRTGDFFASVPAGGDIYLMKSVIHDWDDERSATILRNCRQAMTPTGRVLLIEMTLPTGNEPASPIALWSDLHMMVTTGGRERTVAQFGELLGASGFTLAAVTEPLPGTPYQVITGTPA